MAGDWWIKNHGLVKELLEILEGLKEMKNPLRSRNAAPTARQRPLCLKIRAKDRFC